MKDKSRISKIIESRLLTTILGVVLGFAFSKTIASNVGNIPDSFILLTLVFSFIAVLLTAIILIRTETVEEYRYEVTKILGDGFVRIYRDSISEFATTLVNRSKYVRVVGTARQDVVGSTSLKGAKDYLKALENKLSIDCQDQANAFTYLRVIPRVPSEEMNKHITNCLAAATGKCHKFDAKTDLHFPFYVSFQVFDNTDLLIILDNKGYNKKYDNALCLWSRNKEIIEIFIKRFDDGWEDINK